MSGLRTVESLGQGEHICGLYGSEREHRAMIAPYLRQGFAVNERVLYIVDAHKASSIMGYLAAEGVDVSAAVAKGQLVVAGSRDSYLSGGRFDPDRMIAVLQHETDKAKLDGFAGLRVTGEMSWAIGGATGAERLIEYEIKLNRFFPASSSHAICQYDRRAFSPGTLLQVLQTHPVAIVDGQVYENHYYIPPDDLQGPDPEAAILANRLRTLKERSAAARELERRTAELEAFSYSVSHDLRAPLRRVAGFADLLQRRHGVALGAEGIGLLRKVLDGTRTMSEIIDGLLQLSRVTRAELDKKEVDLCAMAGRAAAELSAASSHRVEFFCEPGLRASGDEPLLRLAVTNLLGNAWKFTAKSPQPRVWFQRDASTGALCVRDNGVGFDPSDAHRLFQAFQRLHGDGDYPGTGIGLVIARRVIERHGGRIWAESRPQEGASFFFTLGAQRS